MRYDRRDKIDPTIPYRIMPNMPSPGWIVVSRYAKNMRRNPTQAEQRMIDALKLMGERSILSQIPIHNMIIDIILPYRNLLIEVDGYTHTKQEQINKDRSRDHYLHSVGFNMVRITNKQTRDIPYITSLISQYPQSDPSKELYDKAKDRAMNKRMRKRHG